MVLGDSETPGIELFVQLRLLLPLEVRISAHFLGRILTFAAPILAEARARAGPGSGNVRGVARSGSMPSPQSRNHASAAHRTDSRGEEGDGDGATAGVRSAKTIAVARYELTADTQRVEVQYGLYAGDGSAGRYADALHAVSVDALRARVLTELAGGGGGPVAVGVDVAFEGLQAFGHCGQADHPRSSGILSSQSGRVMQ